MVAFAQRPALRPDRDVFLELAHDLPGKWSALALEIAPDASEQDLKTMGQCALTMRKGSQWWTGDWYLHVKEHTRLKVRDLVVFTDTSEETLRKIAVVCRAFPMFRRRNNLSFWLHAEVVPFVPEQQDMLLDLCIQHGWTRTDLRKHITKTFAPPDEIESALPEMRLYLDTAEEGDEPPERAENVADIAFARLMDGTEGNSEHDLARMPPERREGENREFAAGSTPPAGILSLTSKDGLLEALDMTRLMDTHSNLICSGTNAAASTWTGKVRRPVMVDGKLYIALRLTRDLETNADRAHCVPLMLLEAYLKAHSGRPGYVTPISVDIWQQEVKDGTRQLHDYSYLRVYDDPYTGLYVILPGEQTFAHVREEAAEWDGEESEEEEADCPHCGEADCDHSCTAGILAEATVEFRLHTRLASALPFQMLQRFAPEQGDVPFAAFWGHVLTAMANRIQELEAVNQAVAGELAKQLVPEPVSDQERRFELLKRLQDCEDVPEAEIEGYDDFIRDKWVHAQAVLSGTAPDWNDDCQFTVTVGPEPVSYRVDYFPVRDHLEFRGPEGGPLTSSGYHSHFFERDTRFPTPREYAQAYADVLYAEKQSGKKRRDDGRQLVVNPPEPVSAIPEAGYLAPINDPDHLPHKNDPFCTFKIGYGGRKDGGVWVSACGVDDRLSAVARFSEEELRRAKEVPHLQKRVVQAIESRLRALEKATP